MYDVSYLTPKGIKRHNSVKQTEFSVRILLVQVKGDRIKLQVVLRGMERKV